MHKKIFINHSGVNRSSMPEQIAGKSLYTSHTSSAYCVHFLTVVLQIFKTTYTSQQEQHIKQLTGY